MELDQSIVFLKSKIKQAFDELLVEVSSSIGAGIKSDYNFRKNDVYLLGGYLSFIKSIDIAEIVIEVDILKKNGDINILSDLNTYVYQEDGQQESTFEVLGPEMVISNSDSNAEIDKSLNQWFIEFKQFLVDNHVALIREISELE